jgi:hypothetical protein
MAATQLNQPPELYTAFERDETNFPVQYIGANAPQAWVAGSAFMLTQALLGLPPDAPRKKLCIDPSLPQWLPNLAVHHLRLGKHKSDIRFWRERGNLVRGDQRRCQAGRALRYRPRSRGCEPLSIRSKDENLMPGLGSECLKGHCLPVDKSAGCASFLLVTEASGLGFGAKKRDGHGCQASLLDS